MARLSGANQPILSKTRWGRCLMSTPQLNCIFAFLCEAAVSTNFDTHNIGCHMQPFIQDR